MPCIFRRFALLSVTLLPIVACRGEMPEPAALLVEPSEVEARRKPDSNRSRVEVQTVLRNVGGEPLRITGIRTGCACSSAAPLESADLAPGESVVLKLNVAVPAFGSEESLATIFTDSPVTPTAQVSVRARGEDLPVPHVQSATPRLELVGSAAGLPLEGEVEVVCVERADEPYWVCGLTASSTDASAELVGEVSEVRLTEDTVVRRYHFTVRVGCPAEYQRVVVFTVQVRDVPGQVTLADISVVARNAPAVRWVPAELTLQVPHENGITERRVVLIADDAVPFAILDMNQFQYRPKAPRLVERI